MFPRIYQRTRGKEEIKELKCAYSKRFLREPNSKTGISTRYLFKNFKLNHKCNTVDFRLFLLGYYGNCRM